MDNKQWKLSCYGNYSKWQQSPGYLLPHLHSFSSHPLRAFPEGSIKPYATLISTAKTGRNVFFPSELPGRLIHLFPFSLCSNCRSALAGWLPCSVLPRAGNLKYCLELDILNTHIFFLTITAPLSCSSASTMVSVCLKHSPKVVAKDQISKGG